MRKEKYVYNPETLSFEKVKVDLKKKVLKSFGFLSSVIVTSMAFFFILPNFMPTPKEEALKREINQMEYKYLALNNQLDVVSKVLENVQERDASVHRMVFGMEPINHEVWEGGVGGA